VSLMGLELLFMPTPFLDGGVDGGFRVVQEPGRLSKRRFGGMETFGNFSAGLIDLHHPEIELLQFDEWGKFLTQRVLSINAGAMKA